MIRLFSLCVLLGGILACSVPHRPIHTEPVAQDTIHATDTGAVAAEVKPPVKDSQAKDAPLVAPKAPQRKVRVAVKRDQKELRSISYGRARLRSGDREIRLPAGALSFSSVAAGRVSVSGHGRQAELTLPCTLTVVEDAAVVDIGETTYRGGLILKEDAAGMLVINYVPVEQYLRGVVPLEIGQRSMREVHAMKAQAVAARTYTYRKMEERKKDAFDLVATVQDQVYGGVFAEYRGSDHAVRHTAGLVMYSGDSLVEAFYHSTCGGKTANIEDVWRTNARSYLTSQADTHGSGVSWCAHSPRYTWEERWERDAFEKMLYEQSRKIDGYEAFSGSLTGVAVTQRASCGRILACRITSTTGEWEYGGDRIRHLFRHPETGGILHSAHFSITLNENTVVARGKGFGHGIGMCQMGAIGQARAGLSFSDILQGYYGGTKIKKSMKRRSDSIIFEMVSFLMADCECS
ncbi:SpoIID/LytB domain-containing protein [Chitinivibrio alkaliphilus]|uniref:SpoIID/LytB domain protein n=1 Tax=Chitinivibrio alkaliphilus ACht1 TaxID=1313304 RepID=U7D4I1_9BACT|nr:SpoIID/LytB domain-containing protein [Chitinivibrio alkaliphilus]ERP31414.1 SpoIID/LytB domain protein [Chitinivibrio alkaliphilus ACht1]